MNTRIRASLLAFSFCFAAGSAFAFPAPPPPPPPPPVPGALHQAAANVREEVHETNAHVRHAWHRRHCRHWRHGHAYYSCRHR